MNLVIHFDNLHNEYLNCFLNNEILPVFQTVHCLLMPRTFYDQPLF